MTLSRDGTPRMDQNGERERVREAERERHRERERERERRMEGRSEGERAACRDAHRRPRRKESLLQREKRMKGKGIKNEKERKAWREGTRGKGRHARTHTGVPDCLDMSLQNAYT